ncbi:MAG: hypothetical protein B6D72_05395 [gamma proteobacterium symbiont of Ctena orbiculata]|uniref:DUF502 domain-containing protein n=1 Tax=Candidatus Thiodiazotropha taylori TaxID=2792791 RepID=A0A944QU88_9GAMM|nr:DUF502 domain-containing protein [Candidatus Thiodiazotropha taylori]PUB90165.1 MAG: hypothetical protein DBP00_00410 [gamma proteobacterium symbiont of Ctena orbiculata]MBT2988366.1 DUF502 domain-containing protein [Candidatus Thiodiazotropha taylori]MBT3027836.1 DUF502 domain-containing protein [Candidatus Thiodiazotropha taylori]MBT3035448.1 DUF502 domain-containing protein [Candidatus Thiodiazotropha taylori]
MKSRPLHIQRYLISGIITLIPLWVTWLVFKYVFNQLSKLGSPWVKILSRSIQNEYPSVAQWLLEPWFQNTLAVLLMLVGLYLVGLLASRVIGRKILYIFESTVQRLPVIQNVYGLVKKLISALEQKPENVQQVVLIEFPSPEMKTVGFVTRTMVDHNTGQQLAAVYVPTTPNPTSGYLEIVPIEKLVSTNWSMDEAMNFIISGGAVAPETVPYGKKKSD